MDNSNVIQLPTARRSYLAIRQNRGVWWITLVTPGPFRRIETKIEGHLDKATAIDFANQRASDMALPVMQGGQVISE